MLDSLSYFIPNAVFASCLEQDLLESIKAVGNSPAAPFQLVLEAMLLEHSQVLPATC
jgi:hypothetical protein